MVDIVKLYMAPERLLVMVLAASRTHALQFRQRPIHATNLAMLASTFLASTAT